MVDRNTAFDFAAKLYAEREIFRFSCGCNGLYVNNLNKVGESKGRKNKAKMRQSDRVSEKDERRRKKNKTVNAWKDMFDEKRQS
jgi:hypothetical protein